MSIDREIPSAPNLRCRYDETPPWHPYDGCYGCRRGNALAERAIKRAEDEADV